MAKAVPTMALLAIIGNVEEERVGESTDSQSPLKNRPKKTSSTTTKSTTLTKNKVKSTLKEVFPTLVSIIFLKFWRRLLSP
jgi:hypothetical protein